MVEFDGGDDIFQVASQKVGEVGDRVRPVGGSVVAKPGSERVLRAARAVRVLQASTGKVGGEQHRVRAGVLVNVAPPFGAPLRWVRLRAVRIPTGIVDLASIDAIVCGIAVVDAREGHLGCSVGILEL